MHISNAAHILLGMGVAIGSHQTSNVDLTLLDMGVGSHQTSNAGF